jgi:hypothetical protein
VKEYAVLEGEAGATLTNLAGGVGTTLTNTIAATSAGEVAVTGLAATAAVGAWIWAITDIRSVWSGEKTLTKEADEFWGKKGFNRRDERVWEGVVEPFFR